MDFLKGGVAVAAAGALRTTSGAASCGMTALKTPDVKFKDLQTGDMGVEGGRDAMKKLGSRLEHDIVFLAHHGQNGVDKDFYAAVKPEAAVWPLPSWLWDNRVTNGTYGSGHYRTNYTKCWMQDLGVKTNYVLLKDYLFV